MTTFEEAISTANVLVGNKNYKDAITHYEEALSKSTFPEQKIDIFNSIGRLYLISQDANNAIINFEKALDVHALLPEDKAEKLIVNKATILNNLGVLKLKTKIKSSLKHHKEALEIFEKINTEFPGEYTLHLANTHYSYGDASYLKGDYFMAKKQFRDAIAVYESLGENESTQPLIANAYYNLGNIYTDEDNVYDARINYLKALKIFRVLAEKQPEAYLSLVGATFNNLAVTAKSMFKYADAITYYENALVEYKKLIEIDRNTFLPFYASTLNSIGIIYTEQHEVKDDFDSHGLSSFSGFGTLSVDNAPDEKKEQLNQHRKEKAVEYYQQALDIYNELAEKESDTYTHYVATCLHNLGVLHDEKKDFVKGEEYYEKALNIRRRLADKQPEAFNLDTCVTLLNILTMYQTLLEQTGEIGFRDEAIKILNEIDDRLSIFGDSDKPIIVGMRGDSQYFLDYFNKIDAEYLEVLEAIRNANSVTEIITETVIPADKLQYQVKITQMLSMLYAKYPNNERLRTELSNAYIQYSWFALRSNDIQLAETALKNGFKVTPNSLVIKANQAHVHLIQGNIEKAKEIYTSLKDAKNDENESFIKVLEADLQVLKSDGVLKQDVKEVMSTLLG